MAFSYYRSITVDHTKCGTADSTNYPALIHLNNATFKTVGNGGHVQNSNAYDVGFFSDSLGTSPLPWDLFYYDGTNGEIYAFVKVGTLSHSVDNVLYVFYGDATISTYQSTVSSVYNSDFKRVMHLNESAHPYHDVTSNAYDSTSTNDPTQVAGKFGYAQSFVGGSSQGITGMNHPAFAQSQITYSGWFKSSTTNNISVVLDTRVNAGMSNGVLYVNNNVPSFYTNNVGPIAGSSGICDGNWHFMLCTAISGTNMTLYIDGSSVASTGGSGAINNAGTCRVGESADVSPVFGTCVLQEVRQLTVVVSTFWITADYNSQSSPDTFITVGSENSIGGGVVANPFGGVNPLRGYFS